MPMPPEVLCALVGYMLGLATWVLVMPQACR